MRPPHRELCRRPNRAAAARILDVLPVGGDDERGAACKGREEARRDEEVRVDDVGAEGVRRPQHVDREPRVPVTSTAAVDDGPRQLVTASLERVLQRCDERAEIRRVRPGVHLGDEQDPHAGSLGVEAGAQGDRPSSPAVVGSPELAQRAADLAHRAARPEGVAHRWQQVAGAGGGLADGGERARCVLGIAFGPHAYETVALALLPGRVDAMELDARLGLLAELVDADDDRPTRFDGGLEAVGGLLDLALDEAGLDRRDSTAELVDAGNQLGRALLRDPR